LNEETRKKMKTTAIHWVAIASSILILALAVYLMETKAFFVLMGVAVLVGVLPFVLGIMYETRVEREKEQMFLEFARNLVESVKAGNPISKSITNVKDKSYGVLSPHVEKLANQILLGIALNTAFKTFADDIGNKSISRSITLIGQAERAGGDIGEILEAVAGAVNTSDKLRKEREANISALVVQGYIIFFVFTIIILVMQFKILPLVEGIAFTGDITNQGLSSPNVAGGNGSQGESFTGSFLYLLLVQGFFSGLAIGKLSGGGVKSGVKHSFWLMFMSFFISAIAGLIFG